MTYYHLSTAEIPRRDYRINELSRDRPLQWIKLGWRDFTERPAVGIVYGALIAVIGFLLTVGLIAQQMFYLVPIFSAGFFLIGPILAVGLFADAKLRHAGEEPERAENTGRILARNLMSISSMGIILMLIFMNWLMLSNLLFGSVFSQLMPTWTSVQPLSSLWSESLPFIAIYVGIGAILAALVFRMSAIAIPMMVDHDIDVFNAIFASWKAVGENAAVMTKWAALIVGLGAIGFVTFFIGFIFVIPVMGYASWHAYRETMQLESEF
jgi:uncharacterized membrane protein